MLRIFLYVFGHGALDRRQKSIETGDPGAFMALAGLLRRFLALPLFVKEFGKVKLNGFETRFLFT